ncbi:DUF2171 domain-containing protein [Sphingomonas sp. CL5.1]|uniref:DUF2171 domain-containing protein n=1 Tax=Sphingomonas sp. CL5.1 TaxID=2653203 RepID=UPI0015818B30|nr:DUF2171 domain-containing protein [Sphingomonas sp. CL5.1]QKS01625.1 DUF2171 domain-containing protein [Sphingomonas sp. CL5.1]
MGYERYRGGGDPSDFGRDFGSGRDYTYSSGREYLAAGAFGPNRARYDVNPYGPREYGHSGYGDRERYGRPEADREYHGSYASDGRRFEDVGRHRDWDDDDRHSARRRDRGMRYARSGPDYDYQDRGFFARAGDELRSWFGDEDAERRRQADMWNDERYGERWSGERDADYGNWRRAQIAALDRDYDEYRREHRTKFEHEFGTWRVNRQTQRDSLTRVREHMEVLGADGGHVGTVDKVHGDRILLTKSDEDAGGRHHSIPSNWIATVDDKVTLAKTAEAAKQHWRDEENNRAMFGDREKDRGEGLDPSTPTTRELLGRNNF